MKGQIIIPKPLRVAHRWKPGQKLIVIDTGDGILLKPEAPFQETTLDDVVSCLKYEDSEKSLQDMEETIHLNHSAGGRSLGETAHSSSKGRAVTPGARDRRTSATQFPV